ncbi:hypothetical protein FO519_003930 [Halicephalobus sp. NKZ332]|nr:hypothetical protein FO519_003930 [Halicephalobus sp. NKZ332]
MKYFLLFLFFVTSGVRSLPVVPNVDDPDISTPTETPEETFARTDSDGDSELSFDEFLHSELSYVQLKKTEFDMLDTDKDGLVSHDEYASFYEKEKSDADENQKRYFVGLFKEFDANNDKRLSQTEVKKILSKRFLLQAKDNFPELFQKFDEDKDGGLDLEEYKKFDQTFPFYELEPINYNE